LGCAAANAFRLLAERSILKGLRATQLEFRRKSPMQPPRSHAELLTRCALVLACCLAASPVRGQVFNPPIRELTAPGNLELADSSARKRLALVDAYLAAQKWGEAVEGLVALQEDYPGKVIELAAHPAAAAAPGAPTARQYTQHVSVREYCHRRFVALPSKALEIYRSRVDPQARELFERAQARDVDVNRAELLRSIADQFFASSWGDDALFALGELALADGDFDLARSCWTRILPRDPQATSPAGLAYPDSDVELAGVYARLVLTSILEGSPDRALRELRSELPTSDGRTAAPGFATRYPQATGRLAGKQGIYAEQLESLLDGARTWPAPVPSSDWPMFAGAPTRNKRMPKELDVVGQLWRRPLPAVRSPERANGPRRVAEDRTGLLSYHPVVSGNLILTNTEEEVFAFDLVTGKPAWATGAQDGKIYPLGDGTEPAVRVARPQSVGVPRFTLTVHGHRLFARVGTPYTNLQRGIGMVTGTCSLVCLDLNAQGKLLWKLDPDEEAWSFEGSPICDGQNVYIAMRNGAGTPQAFVACFDVDTKALKWRTRICGADTLAQGALGEITHNLLTMARGTIYFNTNLGAVAALRARDGQLKWVTVYPRATSLDPGKSADFTCRDLTPCVYYQGQLLVAPSDTEYVFALDAETGQLEWETDLAKDVVHLLGVTNGHLIASGDRLYWISVNSLRRDHGGRINFQWPDQPKSGVVARGRGALAGPYVYWPTEEFLYVFHQRLRDTMQVGQPVRLSEFGASGGNLVATDRYLLIAGERELIALSQASAQRREPLEVTIEQRPNDAEPYFHLARHDEANGRWEDAVAEYQQCLDRCTPAVLLRGRELASVARERLCQLLTTRAERLAAESKWLAAAERLDQAARYAPTRLAALEATLRSADLCWQAGQGARAVEHWQAIVADTAWAGLDVEDSAGRPIPARRAAQRLIAKAIERFGPGVYAPQEAQAAAALTSARKDGNRAEVARLAALFPNAKATADSLAWLSLAANPSRSVPPVHSPEADEALGRALWQRTGETPVAGRVLFAEAASPHSKVCWLSLAEDAIHLVAPETGRPASIKIPWRGAAPRWAGFSGDLLLLGTAYEIVALSAASGEIRWRRQFAAVDGAASAFGSPGENMLRELVLPYRRWTGVLPEVPTGEAAAEVGQAADAVGPDDDAHLPTWGTLGDSEGSQFRDELEQFVIAASASDGMLLVRQGRSRVLALSPATGDVLWVHVPTSAALQPHLALCGPRVVLQYGPHVEARKPHDALAQDSRMARLVILSTADGRVLSDHLPTTLSAWPRAPLAFDSRRLVLIPDAHSLQMIDLEAGRVLWQQSGLIGESPGLEPDVLSTAEELVLVLSGQALSRLDPATGNALWPREVLLTTGGENVREPRRMLAMDRTAVYGVSGGIARAFSLADGRPLWKADEYLGEKETRWRVLRVGSQLAAYPTSAPAENLLELILLNPLDGRPVQRLTFAARTEKSSVRLGPRDGIILSADTAWLLERRK